MGKVAGWLALAVVAVIAIAVIIFFSKGFGLGPGNGKEGGGEETSTAEITQSVSNESNENSESGSEKRPLIIEVKKGQYYIDNEEKTLPEIEEILKHTDLKGKTVTITNNYGSAKALDELRALCTEYELGVVEE